MISAFGVEHTDDISKGLVSAFRRATRGYDKLSDNPKDVLTVKKPANLIRGAKSTHYRRTSSGGVLSHEIREGNRFLKPKNEIKVKANGKTFVGHPNDQAGGLTTAGKITFVGVPVAGTLAAGLGGEEYYRRGKQNVAQ
jgi:hypothetical protein